jgi:electron transport complex protein RnfB
MLPVTGEATGWNAWTQQQADAARERHDRHLARVAREREAAEARAVARRTAAGATGATRTGPASADVADTDNPEAKKRAIIQGALERARKKKEAMAAEGNAPQNMASVSADVQAQIDTADARRRRLGIGAATDDAGAHSPANPDQH